MRLKLGCGLIEDRPRAKRARMRHLCPLRRGSGLIFLPKQENKNDRGMHPQITEVENQSCEPPDETATPPSRFHPL